MSRVSVKMIRPYSPDDWYEVGAYLDDDLISQGESWQFEQVVAFAHEVAIGCFELDESPFGGYYGLSWDDLDEWYEEFIEEGMK